MPTYEYRCERGHEFEREQNINDKPYLICQETLCGAKVERLISSKGSFILKGKTWAKDGYTK